MALAVHHTSTILEKSERSKVKIVLLSLFKVDLSTLKFIHLVFLVSRAYCIFKLMVPDLQETLFF